MNQTPLVDPAACSTPPRKPLSESAPRTRLVLLIAVIANPFCLLLCVASVRSALADMTSGDVQGTVFTVDSDGGRSVVPGAKVRIVGPELSRQTVTDQQGNYSFTEVTPASYRIEVEAPGLVGSKAVTVVAGATLDASIQLEVESVKESVTVTGNDEPALPTDPSGQTTISRSTVVNCTEQIRPFRQFAAARPGSGARTRRPHQHERRTFVARRSASQ